MVIQANSTYYQQLNEQIRACPDQEVVVERWGRGEAREKKREELQAMLLLSDKQMPKKFV